MENSLKNLQLSCLDVFYLQNSAENLIPIVGREKYKEILSKSFEKLESLVQQGKIKNYGLSSWLSFRS